MDWCTPMHFYLVFVLSVLVLGGFLNLLRLFWLYFAQAIEDWLSWLVCKHFSWGFQCNWVSNSGHFGLHALNLSFFVYLVEVLVLVSDALLEVSRLPLLGFWIWVSDCLRSKIALFIKSVEVTTLLESFLLHDFSKGLNPLQMLIVATPKTICRCHKLGQAIFLLIFCCGKIILADHRLIVVVCIYDLCLRFLEILWHNGSVNLACIIDVCHAHQWGTFALLFRWFHDIIILFWSHNWLYHCSTDSTNTYHQT